MRVVAKLLQRAGVLLFCATAGTVALAQPKPSGGSLLGDAWALDPETERVDLSLYRTNYLLPVRYSDNVNPAYGAGVSGFDAKDKEVKFKVSFKARVLSADGRRWGGWLTYSQQSHWQVYHAEASRPYRETNYVPEAIVVYDPRIEVLGLRWRLAGLSFTHESNGQAAPLSRSWNRAIAMFGFERGDFALMLRPWTRLKESADKDDNPDITHYLGHGDLTMMYHWDRNSFSLMMRSGKGAVQAGWIGRKWLGPLRGYVQLFSGYGESLIDYNWRQKTLGIGVALNDMF
jgi:phospholipase A1